MGVNNIVKSDKPIQINHIDSIFKIKKVDSI